MKNAWWSRLRVGRAMLLAVALLAALLASGPVGSTDAAAETGTTPRIINGTPAAQGDYPFLAGIAFGGNVGCGGSLIHPSWVVTAAHCLDNETPGNVQVGLGNTDLTAFEQLINAQQLIQHPRWTTGPDAGRPGFDIALIQLATPANVASPNIGLINMNSDPQRPLLNSTTRVIGWGDTDGSAGGSAFPNPAHQVDVNVVDCGADPGLIFMICAFGPGGNDACQGDSGGPLVQMVDGNWLLVGTVQSGPPDGTCGVNPAGFYEHVSRHLDWIAGNSAWVKPATPSGYVPVVPSRILDSRPGQPGQGANNAIVTPWGVAETRTVQLGGVGGVPTAGVTAVAVHVTSVGPTADTFLTVWPSGPRPTAASKNFGITAGGPFGHTALANDLLIVPMGPKGNVQVFNSAGSTDLVFDVVGYFSTITGDPYQPLPPARIIDSRPATQVGPFNTPWGPTITRTVTVTGVGGVPAGGVNAVALHVTSVSPTGDSFVTAWAAGARPLAANKNFGTTVGGGFGHTALTNDLLIVPVAPDGTIQVFNSAGSVDLVMDVVGWFGPAAPDRFDPVVPVRVLDSRPAFPSIGATNSAIITPWAVQTRTVQLTNLATIPANATAVVAHVTSVSPTANSFMTVWPNGLAPLAANKNFGPGNVGPLGHAALTNDLLIISVDQAADTAQFLNAAGSVDIVVDIIGYMTTGGG